MTKLMIDIVDETNELTEQQLIEIENLLNFAAEKQKIEE